MRMRYLQEHVITRHAEHGEWNYALRPAPPQQEHRPGPAPAGPDPGLLCALAALAGVPAPAALLAATGPAFAAAREYRLHAGRGGERRRQRAASPYRKLSDEALLVAAACHARLAMPWALLARLLGVHPASLSVPAASAATALRAAGLAEPAGARIKTITALLSHAAAARLTIPLPDQPRNGTQPATTRPKQPAK
jgi:hypothetical protein